MIEHDFLALVLMAYRWDIARYAFLTIEYARIPAYWMEDHRSFGSALVLHTTFFAPSCRFSLLPNTLFVIGLLINTLLFL
jgi:hypothetical protein